MSQKRSFFERLTGASWSEGPVKVEAKKNLNNLNKEKKEKTIQKDYPVEKAAKPVKEELEMVKPEKPERPGKEEWPVESEGQLTIDVYQTPSEIVIKSTIAGVNHEDIDISITNDMVTIKGKREKDEDTQEEDYYYQECYWGPFSRSVILPVDVEAERAAASMKNGILTIRLPKVEKVKTRKITVKSE